MSKHIKAKSPRDEARKIIPILGGIGAIELFFVLLELLIILVFFILILKKVISLVLFLSFVGITLLCLYFIVKSNSKTNIKGWEFLILFCTNLFKNKKLSYKKFIKDVLRYPEFHDDFLQVGNKKLIGYHIDGKNLNSLDSFDAEKELHLFNKVMNNIDFKFNIYKIHETLDLDEMIENQKERLKIIDNDKIKKAVKENISTLENSNIKNNRYVMIFSFKEKDEIDEKIKKINKILNEETSFAQSKLSNQDLLNVLGDITLTNYQDVDNIYFYDNSIKIKGETIKKHFAYLYVSDFAKMFETGWLSRLFNSNSYMVNITIDKPLNDEILDSMRKEIKKNETIISESNNEHEISSRRKMNDLLRNDLTDVKNNISSIKDFAVIIRIEADSEMSLRHKEHKLSVDLEKDGLSLSLLKFNQQEALKYCSPINGSILSNKVEVEVISSFISSSWPFMNDSLFDSKGLIIGSLDEDKLNIIDFKENKNSRINSNMFVLASSGAGKTMTTSTIIDNNIKNGDKIFIIDPENEYKSLANYYDGVVINFSDDENKINLLQIIPSNSDDSIKEHITFLGSFMKNLFPEISNLQLAKFKEYVGILYKNRKINEKAVDEKYKDIKWPMFSDLKSLFDKESLNEDSSIKEQMIVLGTYIDELAVGSYSSLWNCQTKLNFDFNLIVFDISKYVENVRVVSSLMNLISKIVWGEMNKIYEENKNKNINKWTSLVIDEAHLLMNKNNIDSLEWIAQVTKRIRKRSGSVTIITQNVSDFIGDGEIKHISSRIINNCTYSLIGQLKANDLSELEQMYESSGGLSNYEKKFIVNANKFEFVLSVGQEKKVYLKNTRPNELNKKTLGWKD